MVRLGTGFGGSAATALARASDFRASAWATVMGGGSSRARALPGGVAVDLRTYALPESSRSCVRGVSAGYGCGKDGCDARSGGSSFWTWISPDTLRGWPPVSVDQPYGRSVGDAAATGCGGGDGGVDGVAARP